MTQVKHGDFTELADNYAKYRPAYSPFVADIIMSLLQEGAKVADIGAGTGVWGSMLADRGAEVTAVEPNQAMRQAGEKRQSRIARWVAASAEDTTLPAASCDLICMASSFHWTDFDRAIREFDRILKPGGKVLVLWNPRVIDDNPLLVRIEKKLREIAPDMKRVSSGKSEFCESLTGKFERDTPFNEVMYIEGHHAELQTPEHYLGVWKSVNDIQAQIGSARFDDFLRYIQEQTEGLEYIEAHYTTRAWLARKKQ